MCRLSRCNEVGWLFQRASRSCMLCLRRVLRRRRVIDRFAGSPTHFSAWDKLVLHKWCWPTLSFPTFSFFYPKEVLLLQMLSWGRQPACQHGGTHSDRVNSAAQNLWRYKTHTTYSQPFWHFFIPHLWSTRPNSTLSPCSVHESRYILQLRSGQCSRSLWALIDFAFDCQYKHVSSSTALSQ